MDYTKHAFCVRREMDPDEYVAFCGTHCDRIMIPEDNRNVFQAFFL